MVKECFRNVKNGEIEKSALGKKKHAMDRKPVLLKHQTNKN